MIIKYNNVVLKYEDKWLNSDGTPIPPGPTPTFEEVTIGTQIWMKTNLAVDDGQGGIYINDDVSANGSDFGTQYYYNWWAANRVAESIEGWHLPTRDEWITLFNYVGYSTASAKLKSTYGWYTSYGYYPGNGTDDYGFCVLPVGLKYNDQAPTSGHDYHGFGNVAQYWAVWDNPTYQYPPGSIVPQVARFDYDNDGTPHWSGDDEVIGHSVRLIKDT